MSAIGGTFNRKTFLTKVAKSAKFNRATFKNAEKKYEIERKRLIAKFRDHPVTSEINGGVFASNESNTLGGKGNLFTYIGCRSRTRPVSPVERVLLTSGGVKRGSKPRTNTVKGKIRQRFKAKLPETGLLKAASPLPFQEGRSWLFDIESGISGFNSYLVKKWTKGRSGQALQVKKSFRGGSYSPPSNGYIRSLLADFIRSFK